MNHDDDEDANIAMLDQEEQLRVPLNATDEDGFEGEGHDVEMVSEDRSEETTMSEEMKSIVTLAAGIFLSRISWVAMKTTDSAILGHWSTKALTAASLSDLWTSATGVLSYGGVLGIFVGQAIGAGNDKLAVIWLQVGIVVVLVLTVPIMVCWCLTGPVLRLFHADETILDDAGYYATILSLGLPGMVVMMQLSQFMSANKVVSPEANVAMFACVFNLVFGVLFVFGFNLGFRACPWVTTATEYLQLVLLYYIYGYRQKLHIKLGWIGWQWNEITMERTREFLALYFPSVLAMASDFWRVAIIGSFASSFLGSDAVSVFNASYRILWISLTVVGAVAGATRIRLAQFVGKGDVGAAKRSIATGAMLVISLLSITTTLTYFCMDGLASIFSDDPHIKDQFWAARFPISLTLFSMNLAVFLEQIPYAMGQVRVVVIVGVIGSWIGQVPAVFLSLEYWREDVSGLYYGVSFGYILTSLLLTIMIMKSNWKEIIRQAMERSEAS